MVINGVLDADIACLPEADVKLEKPQNCVVAGWGWSGSSFENQLQDWFPQPNRFWTGSSNLDVWLSRIGQVVEPSFRKNWCE
jgi:hypothetical protein